MRKKLMILMLLGICILFCIGVVAAEEVDLRGIQSDWYHYRVEAADSEFAQYEPQYFSKGYQVYDYEIDAEVARKLGDEAIKWYWGEDVLKHTKYEVCEVAGKDYYVITRKPKLLFGASYQVCISKKDGAILRAEKL